MPYKNPNSEAARRSREAGTKKWRAANPDRVREMQRRYREKHREALLLRKRAEYRRNKKKRLATNEAWRKRNAERVRLWERAYQACRAPYKAEWYRRFVDSEMGRAIWRTRGNYNSKQARAALTDGVVRRYLNDRRRQGGWKVHVPDAVIATERMRYAILRAQRNRDLLPFLIAELEREARGNNQR